MEWIKTVNKKEENVTYYQLAVEVTNTSTQTSSLFEIRTGAHEAEDRQNRIGSHICCQGPIIQVWPSGQITLTGDVIGSGGGTMRYEATLVFRDPAMKLV